jgi:rubrerythrin
MGGGINAWKGLAAVGAPESGMAYFPPAASPEELIGLAWSLEDGSHKFYSELAATLTDKEAQDLYHQLAAAEEHHQDSLQKLYRELSVKAPDPGFPGSVIPPGKVGNVMEGGMLVDEALRWTEGRNVADILDLSLSLETNSYDLYLKMERQTKDQRSAQVFNVLSREEKQHLERLSSLLEKRI